MYQAMNLTLALLYGGAGAAWGTAPEVKLFNIKPDQIHHKSYKVTCYREILF